MPEDESLIWLFDYDLTLYGEEERGVLDSLDRNITLFVQDRLKTDFETAGEFRKNYLRKYGTTLAGLRALHGVDPHEFFDFIHTNPGLVLPKLSPEKRALLEQIRGRKFIFTNAREDWSLQGLKSMGLENVFDGILDLNAMNWEGKPSENAYGQMELFLETRGVWKKGNKPSRIILLEDSLQNLKTAHARGWTTVWISPAGETPAWVDFHFPHLKDLKEWWGNHV
ncbi:MAG: pyrimidine 5'-nucleotidase [Fibrobacter sp.]|jgi:putative hydrolase of the HAD superfamily|nr:pyrimidine 5'-nucleotidase [Fibrobacter sp.]